MEVEMRGEKRIEREDRMEREARMEEGKDGNREVE